MTRGRDTRKMADWQTGAIVPSFPVLRCGDEKRGIKGYGDPIASAAEMAASMFADARDQPTSQDRKRTLELLRDQPAAMSELAELREERANLARRAQGLNARYPKSQRMPQTDADELDAMLARVEQIDQRITALKTAVSQLDPVTQCEMVRQAYRCFGTVALDQLSPESFSACATAALSAAQGAPGRPRNWLAVWLVRVVIEQLGDVPASERDEAVRAVLHESGVASSDPRNVRHLVGLAKKAAG
jgi:hypothetical protein